MSAGRRAALVVAGLALSPLAARAGEVVRIAVTVGAGRVALEAASLGCAALPGDAALAPVPRGRAELELDGDVVRLGNAVAAVGFRCAAPGPIRHAGLELAGEVEVRRGARGLDVVHALAMEDYVAAVTASEMPPSFPLEALKAQAVAARTFAIGKKVEAVAAGRAFHLGSTVLHQVYRASAAVDPRARAAADATAGEVLAYDHEPADAFFHSSCGGTTESGAAALGRDRPYLSPVACDRCGDSPLDRWTLRIDAAELGRALGLRAAVRAVRIAERTATGRASVVEVEAGPSRVRLGGADLRQRLGFSRLRSLAIEVRRAGGAFEFSGRGAGHGAGMCQWGAAGHARDGRGYREILARYYPGAELVRMY